ncbi:MAG: glycosyltransferase family 2 protein [Sphingobacteriia bacterium]|jgi:glycosyltransferase involved in cell wall biosynthesis
MPLLSVIIPCYYNEENLPVTLPRIEALRAQMPTGSEIEYVLVDDGSKDGTWTAIQDWQSRHPDRVQAIKLSGNFGSYNAILAGMQHASGDVNLVISADLQDPPELIPKMFAYWQMGHKLVLANRTARSDGFFNDLFSNTYQRLLKHYALKNVPDGGFDLVMFDRQLRDEVVRINEKNTNTLYMLLWLKYDYVSIPYERQKREVGKSRWTLRKKIKLLIDTFVSFSFFPIRAITTLGFLLGFLAIIYSLVIITGYIFGWGFVQGWSSMMIVVLFLGAFQMVALGVIGEYVWRALDAARDRPNYIVDQIITKKS